MENFIGLMAEYMKETMKMIKNMAKVFSNGINLKYLNLKKSIREIKNFFKKIYFFL